jgi:hypothetical protein
MSRTLAAGAPLSQAARDALASATVVEGPTAGILAVRLTCGQLKRGAYEQVNAVLGRIAGGGSWHRQSRLHLYEPGRDPAPELAAAVQAGVLPPDPKRTAGWFATPAGVADDLAVNYALGGCELEPDRWRVLEPSAGEGALADALVKFHYCDPGDVTCLEPDPWRAAVCQAKGYQAFTMTFEAWAETYPDRRFELVLMNPPFSLPGRPAAWAEHVKLAWGLLVPGGVLTSIVPASIQWRADRQTAMLRELAERHGYIYDDLAPDAFRESGTDVPAVILHLVKPEPEDEDPPTTLF